MFDELNKYKTNDHFFFDPTDSLEEACNAPDDKDGVYIIYELKNGRVDMVYIGASGINIAGVFRNGLFGLRQGIITGIPPESKPRSRAWPVKMLSENIHALDIYWYVTFKDDLKDHPENVKDMLLDKYGEIYGEFPRWNKQPRRRKRS